MLETIITYLFFGLAVLWILLELIDIILPVKSKPWMQPKVIAARVTLDGKYIVGELDATASHSMDVSRYLFTPPMCEIITMERNKRYTIRWSLPGDIFGTGLGSFEVDRLEVMEWARINNYTGKIKIDERLKQV